MGTKALLHPGLKPQLLENDTLDALNALCVMHMYTVYYRVRAA